MKKTAAFLTALVLFIISVLIIHGAIVHNADLVSDGIGTWINPYKDLSYMVLEKNIDEDTVLMMGSSEFQHSKKSPCHPTKFYRSSGMDVMCVGAAYNQSLSHAITLASTGPSLKSKKVLLILSPAWFSKEGVQKEAFGIRFSETEYMAFLDNPDLSNELKEDIAKRTEKLLSVNPSMQSNVKKYNSALSTQGHMNLYDRLYFSLRKRFLEEKEAVNISAVWRTKGKPQYEKYMKQVTVGNPDFDKLRRESSKSYEENPFHMNQRIYKRKFAPIMKSKKDCMKNRIYPENSPEYKDLELFLRVCKEENIDVEVILLPVNGYWYDYTGFSSDRRKVLPEQIQKVTSQYGAEFVSFYGNDYEDGWLEDCFHPSGEGWLDINEQAWKFFNDANR